MTPRGYGLAPLAGSGQIRQRCDDRAIKSASQRYDAFGVRCWLAKSTWMMPKRRL
jgi:hypothetical protein